MIWRSRAEQSGHMRKWKRWRHTWHETVWTPSMCVCFIHIYVCILGRCVISLKNLFFMPANWWLEWWDVGGRGGGGSLSSSSSSAALRSRAPATLTSRITALLEQQKSVVWTFKASSKQRTAVQYKWVYFFFLCTWYQSSYRYLWKQESVFFPHV